MSQAPSIPKPIHKATKPPKEDTSIIEPEIVTVDIRPLIDIFNKHMGFVYGIYNEIIEKLNNYESNCSNIIKIELLKFDPIYLEDTVVTYNENVIEFGDILKNLMDMATKSVNKFLENKFVFEACKYKL